MTDKMLGRVTFIMREVPELPLVSLWTLGSSR